MTNEFIFGTQIVSMIGYIGAVLILYRILVSAKEATISTKDATIELLKERIEQLENTTPDILLKQLSERYELAIKEIERLSEEKQIEGFKNTALEELRNMANQVIELRQKTQTMQKLDPMIVKAFSIPSTAVPSDVVEKYSEEGTWEPLIQYITGDSSVKYNQAISVDEAKYKFHRGNVKIFFDFSVDLKKVPSGSALAIEGAPFIVDSRNVYEFKVRQTGLNHNEDLTVSARRNFTSFNLAYVTDGSEGSVRFWGYIAYDCDQKVLWDSPAP